MRIAASPRVSIILLTGLGGAARKSAPNQASMTYLIEFSAALPRFARACKYQIPSFCRRIKIEILEKIDEIDGHSHDQAYIWRAGASVIRRKRYGGRLSPAALRR